MIPAAYHTTKSVASPVDGGLVAGIDSSLLSDPNENTQKGLLIISRGTAILLLCLYIAYLFFQLKTHALLFIPQKQKPTPPGDESFTAVEEGDVETPQMSMVAAGFG